MDYIFVWLNAIIWGGIIGIVIHKYSIRNIGTSYIIFYGILCILSLHLFYNPETNKRFEGQNIFALVYLTVFLLLFISPLLLLDKQRPILVHPNKSIMRPLYFFVIIFSLLGLPEIMSNFGEGLIMLATDEEYGQMLYHNLRNSDSMTGNSSHNTIGYLAVLSNFARGFAPFLFLYYLSSPQKKLLILGGLLLSTLISFMNSIAIGSRSAILSMSLNLLFMFIFMKKYYSKNILKVIKPFILIVALVISAAFILMTISRTTQNNESPLFFAERYAAQPVLQFGKYGLDPGGCRYGDRTFPLIKSLFTDNVARGYFDRLNKYQHLKSDESSFITFVGDFTIDYTPIGGAIVMLLLVWFFFVNLKGRKVIFIQHLAIVYLLMLILNGFYLYPLCDYLGNIIFLTYLLFFVFFSITKYGKISKRSKYSYPSPNI